MPERILQSAIDYIAATHGGTLAHHILILALKRVRDSERIARLSNAGVGVWMQRITLVLVLCFCASAKVHPRMFPANHDSVLQENVAAGSLPRYLTQAEVDEDVYNGTLEALYDNNIYVVSPRLPINRRYALPTTVAFVRVLSLEFYRTFGKPLMVDSAIRPATVQRNLTHRNRSAAPAYGERASSHELGTTVDLSTKLTRAQLNWLLYRLLYYRALGRILVIQERACLHIFVKERGTQE